MDISIIGFSAPEIGNFFAKLILWLVTVTSSVVAGVILFTLILKVITLPFDVISRFSMRKNSLKMEQMRPELEKLQQQYADNKDLYNQKMMALYKKNGYSMFGACLPTIITLVIFIIAINGFRNYSEYQNKKYFYDMSIAYNNAIYAGLEIDEEYIYINADGAIQINDEKILEKGATFTPDGKDYEIIIEKSQSQFTVKTTNGYIEYKRGIGADGKPEGERKFTILSLENAINSEYNNGLINADGDTYAEALAKNPKLTASDFLSSIGSDKAAVTFDNNGSSFLWVKNIWVTDSPMKNPVETDWEKFKSTYKYDIKTNDDIGAGGYEKLIAGLADKTTAPNGYFILVALTAVSSLLMQLVLGKSQKAQMELQTVNGQGAQTQKIMTWMMPIMMAVFAFMYTAAFSVYIILSSVISLLTTLLINAIADKKFKKAAETGSTEVVRGRIYIPPKKEEKTPAKKDKKKDKTAEDGFLSGLNDKKKHPRGRQK
ncbi:MAG: YidC/Oxa1 family membrane protein insertase [Clostridia bacterium]|nr:YidC/Oxa1 family membrane protein insertase [Clostridia bacterium]